MHMQNGVVAKHINFPESLPVVAILSGQFAK
jgi:hypothetical protein